MGSVLGKDFTFNRRNMEAFKVGDTVKLNSGGPVMTIESLYQNDGEEKSAKCVWFDEQNRISVGYFFLSLLTKV